jgi:hypothetical protein
MSRIIISPLHPKKKTITKISIFFFFNKNPRKFRNPSAVPAQVITTANRTHTHKMASSERPPPNAEYETESDLIQDFQKTISNPASLNFATQYLFDQLVDETILQVIFRAHFESKHPVGNLLKI